MFGLSTIIYPVPLDTTIAYVPSESIYSTNTSDPITDIFNAIGLTSVFNAISNTINNAVGTITKPINDVIAWIVAGIGLFFIVMIVLKFLDLI